MSNVSSEFSVSGFCLTDAQVQAYRRNGFISLKNVFEGEHLTKLRDAVEKAVASETKPAPPAEDGTLRTPGAYELIFNQKVNLWRRYPDVARFVLSKSLGNLAARLEGVSMRLWHDQALFKEPHSGNNKTPWHQGAPYWPHADRTHQNTIWIALRDATIENGCMAFVAGTQKVGPLPPINLANPQDIFQFAPQIKPAKPQVIELNSGSVTFHNGLTFHYAGPNKSDGTREAFAIIYMPVDCRFDGQRHIVTDPVGYHAGDLLSGDLFPVVSD